MQIASEWIAAFLATEPPRSKSLVMTVIGDAIAPHGGRVWLGSLIELLAPFGVTDRLLRTSVFRLAQEGWLVAKRDGRRSLYAIDGEALPRLERANRRIYAAPGLHWDGRWTLLLAPNGSIDAPVRTALRKELEWEGYAMLAPGVLAHPAPDQGSLGEILARTGAAGKVFICAATELPGGASRPLRELVDAAWDLRPEIDSYRQFSATFTPLLAILQRDGAPAPGASFAIRSLLIHAYRRVQLHDPMLPVELLPAPWPGSDAYALAGAIYRLVASQAEAHVMARLTAEEPAAPQADAAYFERFGGL
ncbi:phenylacetic acid degradation operon negative regulatory protein PaaX [Massilia sp. S19_KUP03_FR1]|uniref:phenylacetic acid degradation operon negative regulatory protein PaaX n=1 Tax=Massilia sp. S19_KUP03_FR1 TaxID=3025503 RepID=UPI002FCDA339